MLKKIENLPLVKILRYAAVIVFVVQFVARALTFLNTAISGAEIHHLVWIFAAEITMIIWQPLVLLALAKIIELKDKK